VNAQLPRPFGPYLLTAALGEDALGRTYRALRGTEERSFVRLRLLDSPELSAEAMLVAIEENGEVHEFLKNAAIARNVEMDAVDGVPYVAWSEPSGRTLDTLIAKCRASGRKIPVEHALLIVEKVATALDHAYNTTIDGDRTLHGLVWPAFVGISDDGEIRLGGFGLAPGVLPSLGKPRIARELAPYLAPEEREQAAAGRNSDVYSVGVLLYELLAGQPPPKDPLAAVKGVAGAPPPPVSPELLALLRMTLAPADARYKSTGDLRRELGKLLFSGPYSPSTFNLAYFLSELFRDEIDAETRSRAEEAGKTTETVTIPGRAAGAPPLPPAAPKAPAARRVEPPSLSVATAPHRSPLAAVGAVLAAAAIAGGVYVVSRKPPASTGSAAPAPALSARPTPTLLPELAATPAGPTSTMSESQFKDEVARRLATEVQKLEQSARAKAAPAAAALPAAAAPLTPTAAPEPTSPPPVAAAVEAPEPTAVPAPTARPSLREGALVALEDVDTPPRISRVIKPSYPPLALRARIGGIVVLRVLVSEKGLPSQVDVVREGRAGLTEAAVTAVRRWTFEPARKDGVAVQTWISVPIPFEP
jgi:TonB family protein